MVVRKSSQRVQETLSIKLNLAKYQKKKKKKKKKMKNEN